MDFIVRDEMFCKKIGKVKDIVADILSKDNEARKDDKWLIIQYMQEVSGFAFPYERLQDLPSFETITRCRRKLQEHGDFAPDSQTTLVREQLDVKFSNWAIGD